MADHSSIEWTDTTWNPVTGCDRVSPGCAHCYALDLAARLKGMGQARYQRDGDPKTSGPGFGVTLHPDKLEEPLRWRKPRMVFVNSMSDLFHEAVPDEFIVRVFGVMARAERHTFQVLTKRPERMQQLLSSFEFREQVQLDVCGWPDRGFYLAERLECGFEAMRNVWLGVSIENRRFVHRADLLRETPAAVRFISAEPLLGPLFAPQGALLHPGQGWEWPDGFVGWDLDLTDIDWLIVGGESGPNHRGWNPEWALDLRDACEEAATAFFMKQVGGFRPGTRLEDLPEGLRIREFPQVRGAEQ